MDSDDQRGAYSLIQHLLCTYPSSRDFENSFVVKDGFIRKMSCVLHSVVYVISYPSMCHTLVSTCIRLNVRCIRPRPECQCNRAYVYIRSTSVDRFQLRMQKVIV